MYRFMSNIVQITIVSSLLTTRSLYAFLLNAWPHLPLVVNHCSKHSNKLLGTPHSNTR